MEKKIRVLTLTSLYPSDARPRHGIFVETRLLNLVESQSVDARVIAPIPWFPFGSRMFGSYGAMARTPLNDVRTGIRVVYPRYLMLPKVGTLLQPRAMASVARREADRLVRGGWYFDLIDAHYFFPDGVAAKAVASSFNVPFVVTARGSDINLLATIPSYRRSITETGLAAAEVITVSSGLKDGLVELGVPSEKITVLRNGVDLDRFEIVDQGLARRQLELPHDGIIVGCVGNFVPEKGFDVAIRAIAQLDDARLLLLGAGPEQGELIALAKTLGVAARVILRPVMPQADLKYVYSAADVLLLTSVREGWPNVVLESLACGTRVVASDVGAVREILTKAIAGRIVMDRTPVAFANAIASVVSDKVPRSIVRKHAQAYGWDEVSSGQIKLFRRILRKRHGSASWLSDPAGNGS